MNVPFVGLLGVTGGLAALGLWEARRHEAALAAISLRVHVNGTRGKTSTTRTIAALLRSLGMRVAAKCTGTLPIYIGPDGVERPWPRRGRARVQEQVRFLQAAARAGAEAAVVECMAVDPALQWICEHRLIRAHIGVITNVRPDHLEDMGRSLEEIARSLANTIPRAGWLVTADERFAPLFAELAAPLGTRVVVARPDRNGDPSAEHRAIAVEVAACAGFPREEAQRAAARLPRLRPQMTPLPPPAEAAVWLHLWSNNDPDSFRAVTSGPETPAGLRVPLLNHRRDRPLRTRLFADLLAEWDPLPRVLVTGEPGAERDLVRAGVPLDRIRRLPFPPRAEDVSRAIADLPGPVVVVGCGNARGMEDFEPVMVASEAPLGDFSAAAAEGSGPGRGGTVDPPGRGAPS